MKYVVLEGELDEASYGGKAAQCARAYSAGLPVPEGFAVSWRDVGRLDDAILDTCLTALGGLVAVRSSAVGEDSAVASFAGQHATILGVHDRDGLREAIAEVVRSGDTPAARGYRAKLGLDPVPRVAVVVQKLVRADVAGVLFDRDPRSGEDVRVIEASYGLGEAVVQGLVTPDRFRVERGGRVVLRERGDKDLEIVYASHGGTEEREVDEARIERLCLGDAELLALDSLASQCEGVFGGTQDLEFAFVARDLYLLQRRAITRG